jgi:hypothetical protein
MEILSEDYIHLIEPEEYEDCVTEISRNPKFYPYFKDCIGAIDGSLIPVSVPAALDESYFCRKGFKAQNILAVVSFDLTFQYVLAGWEGTAHDSRVLDDALGKGFEIPEDKYYLADAGYGMSPHFLTPYRGVRYHLKEWAQAGQQPQNEKELYNLRHSSLRNAIERTFGVLKKRFKVLNTPIEYNLKVQVSLVKALCALHNFIKREGSIDDQIQAAYDEDEQASSDTDSPEPPARKEGTRKTVHTVTKKQKDAAEQLREQIAHAMWCDYLKHRKRAGWYVPTCKIPYRLQTDDRPADTRAAWTRRWYKSISHPARQL